MEDKKSFEPFTILGVFWSAFGFIVLVATFFVRDRPQVPAVRGIVTNLLAGALLLGVGIVCLLKGWAVRREKAAGP